MVTTVLYSIAFRFLVLAILHGHISQESLAADWYGVRFQSILQTLFYTQSNKRVPAVDISNIFVHLLRCDSLQESQRKYLVVL